MGTGYVLYFKRISICKGMWVAYLKGLIYIDATQGSTFSNSKMCPSTYYRYFNMVAKKAPSIDKT